MNPQQQADLRDAIEKSYRANIPKKVIVIGGGTFSLVRNHMALSAPAFGTTARALATFSYHRFHEMKTELILTKMADHNSELFTNAHIKDLIEKLKETYSTKVVFFNVALCDYDGKIGDVVSGKYAERLETKNGPQTMILTPAEKIVSTIREGRKDIFLVSFKTTCNASEQEMFEKGLALLKNSSSNLVLVNDTKTRMNMIVTPEEATYSVTKDRNAALEQLVDIAWYRSHLTFTQSTVVEGTPVSWDSPEVPESLRTIVNHCISQNAYKVFNGATVGHFACKISDTEF